MIMAKERSLSMAKKRVVYFDVLNILAALAVVFLHCNSSVHTFQNTLAWKQALGVEVIFYWAVPIFFMLSGANLMNYRERYSTEEFFKKRLIRILIPFIVFSLIYAVLYKVDPMVIGKREFINRFFNTQIMTIFWFFIPMFSVYLAMPVLSLLKDNRRILWYMAGLGFMLNSFLPQVFRYLGLVWNGSLTFLMTGGFLIFTVLGYLLSQTDISFKKRLIIYGAGLISVILRYFATIHLSVKDGVLNYTFFDYLQWHSVLLAVAVFVAFKHSKWIAKLGESRKASVFLKSLSSLSFGIYLTHYIVIEFLYKFIVPGTYLWKLGVPFLVYAVSAVAVYVLKKIPIIKYIVP